MARKANARILADISEVTTLTSTLRRLDVELNTDRHLHAVTNAAFSVLADRFDETTHPMAAAYPNQFHHIYEWDKIGIPGFQLYTTQLLGQGANRRVSWRWRASKTTVPTTTNPDGTEKFKRTDRFDPEKLNRVHIFVWKAPMMEYGVTVTVRPKLSNVLVFPNAEMLGVGGKSGPSTATFTPHPYTFTPGGHVQGNFSTWFTGWWGSGVAQGALEKMFDDKRNSMFKKSFNARMSRVTGKTRMSQKNISFTPSVQAAMKGKNIARAIAQDMEYGYTAMAAQRRRKVLQEDD